MHISLNTFKPTKQTNWKENEDRNIHSVETKIKWEFNVIMINVSVFTFDAKGENWKNTLRQYELYKYTRYTIHYGLSNQLGIDK